MAGPEILRKIEVKISSDKKNLRGTGFFVSEKEILTCHHVLADGNGRYRLHGIELSRYGI